MFKEGGAVICAATLRIFKQLFKNICNARRAALLCLLTFMSSATRIERRHILDLFVTFGARNCIVVSLFRWVSFAKFSIIEPSTSLSV